MRNCNNCSKSACRSEKNPLANVSFSQSHKDKHNAENFSEPFQWNFSGMIGILSQFIHLRQYSASQEEKYYLQVEPVIFTYKSGYAMLFFNNSDCRKK